MIDENKLIEELKQSGMIADNDYGNTLVDMINSQSKIGEWIREEDNMEELKPCPFCGNKPRLEHRTEVSNRREGSSEICIYWQVLCGYCGCHRNGGYSEYFVNNEGQLELYDKGYEEKVTDARLTAINKWNERLGEDK